jgi:hypothetical protein
MNESHSEERDAEPGGYKGGYTTVKQHHESWSMPQADLLGPLTLLSPLSIMISCYFVEHGSTNFRAVSHSAEVARANVVLAFDYFDQGWARPLAKS